MGGCSGRVFSRRAAYSTNELQLLTRSRHARLGSYAALRAFRTAATRCTRAVEAMSSGSSALDAHPNFHGPPTDGAATVARSFEAIVAHGPRPSRTVWPTWAVPRFPRVSAGLLRPPYRAVAPVGEPCERGCERRRSLVACCRCWCTARSTPAETMKGSAGGGRATPCRRGRRRGCGAKCHSTHLLGAAAVAAAGGRAKPDFVGRGGVGAVHLRHGVETLPEVFEYPDLASRNVSRARSVPLARCSLRGRCVLRHLSPPL